MSQNKPDVVIVPQSSLVLFEAHNKASLTWLQENTNAEPWQWLGPGLAVDQRYADSLLDGLQEAGFLVGAS